MDYCEIKAGETAAANKWYRHCEKEHLPYIVVTRRKKYSSVNWDYISLPKSADAKLEGSAKIMSKQLLEAFHRHANKKSRFTFSAQIGKFDNILPAAARTAAKEVSDVFKRILS